MWIVRMVERMTFDGVSFAAGAITGIIIVLAVIVVVFKIIE